MDRTLRNAHPAAAPHMLALVAKCSRLLIALLSLGSTLAQASSPSVATYMECARAIGVAINDRFAVIPGERFAARGLYVYTDHRAVFLPLGAPHLDDGKANEFFIRTSLDEVGNVVFNFREEKSGNKSNALSAIAYQIAPPGHDDFASFRVTPATGSFDDGARAVLSKRLQEKVVTIKNFIDSKNAYSTPGDARAAFENDRVTYRAKLERCLVEGDRRLKFIASEEIQKLESGFPGATIWEIQIDGRQATGHIRRSRI